MKSITTQSEEFRNYEKAVRYGPNWMKWYEKPRGSKRPLWERLEDQAWRGQPCFLIGGGPSLRDFDFDQLKNIDARIVAVNRAFEVAPFADMMIAIDTDLYNDIINKRVGKTKEERAGTFRAFRDFAGIKLWIDMNNMTAGVDISYLFRSPEPKIHNKMKQGIYAGNNTGVAALAFALTMRCNPIYLLGYDCYHIGKKTHFHSGYERGQATSTVKSFIPKFERLRPEVKRLGLRVINLNPKSMIRCFGFGDREKTIKEISGDPTT